MKVKPLEWEWDSRLGGWKAQSILGEFEVFEDDGWIAHLEGGGTWEWEHVNCRHPAAEQQSKQACQDHHEAMIKSAVQSA